MLDIESGVSGEQTPLLGQRGKLSERDDMTVYRYGLKSGVCSPLTPLGTGSVCSPLVRSHGRLACLDRTLQATTSAGPSWRSALGRVTSDPEAAPDVQFF
jgi:hypothetical protein